MRGLVLVGRGAAFERVGLELGEEPRVPADGRAVERDRRGVLLDLRFEGSLLRPGTHSERRSID